MNSCATFGNKKSLQDLVGFSFGSAPALFLGLLFCAKLYHPLAWTGDLPVWGLGDLALTFLARSCFNMFQHVSTALSRFARKIRCGGAPWGACRQSQGVCFMRWRIQRFLKDFLQASIPAIVSHTFPMFI